MNWTNDVSGYALWWMTGVLLANLAVTIAARWSGVPTARAGIVCVAYTSAAYVGARLHADLFEQHFPLRIVWDEFPHWFVQPGLRIGGGILAGSVVALLVARAVGLAVWDFADMASPFVPLGWTIGRIGCWHVGCCFGRVSSVPWAISYGPGTPPYWNHLARGLIVAGAPRSLPMHPLPLYFMLGGVLAASLSAVQLKRRRFAGQPTWTGLAVTGGCVALVECFREGAGVAPVELRQGVGLAIAAVSLVALAAGAFKAARHSSFTLARVGS